MSRPRRQALGLQHRSGTERDILTAIEAPRILQAAHYQHERMLVESPTADPWTDSRPL